MQVLSHIPQPPLNSFVDLFWFYDGYSPGPHSKERLMPDGSVELVINLKEDEARIYDREKLDRVSTSSRCSAVWASFQLFCDRYLPASLGNRRPLQTGRRVPVFQNTRR